MACHLHSCVALAVAAAAHSPEPWASGGPRRLWPGEHIWSSANDFQEQAGAWVDDTQEQAGQLAQDAQAHAQSTANQTGEWAQNAQEQTGQWAQEAGDHVSDAAADAGGHIVDAADSAGEWVQETGGQIVDAAVGSFEYVKGKFQEAGGLLRQGLGVIRVAIEAAQEFAAHLEQLASDFAPLEPIFASPGGIVPLIASKDNMRTLVGVLQSLLDCSVQVLDMGDALSAVSGALEQIRKTLGERLSGLQGRRLAAVPRRALVGLELDRLLNGLKFDQLAEQFREFSQKAQHIAKQLQELEMVLDPLLAALEDALSGGRRLGVVREFKEDRQRYVNAILAVVPAWQMVEDMVVEVCQWTNAALQETQMLTCRVSSVANRHSLPASGFMETILAGCSAEAVSEGEATCPAVSFSSGVKDLLAESAGVLGWMAVSLEYAITHSTAIRTFIAVLLFVQGLQLAFLGYRWKDFDLYVEGFCAGFVIWSVLFSVSVVVFGVCRGEFVEECSGRSSLIVILVLSCGCGALAILGQAAQVFLFGFDLGAMLGAIFYLAASQDEVFDAFLDVESAKAVAYGLLTTTLLSGVALGIAATFCSRAVIIVTTSVIGGFVIVASVSLLLTRRPRWADLWLWGLLAVVASFVQHRYTAHSPAKGTELVGEAAEQQGCDYSSGDETTPLAAQGLLPREAERRPWDRARLPSAPAQPPGGRSMVATQWGFTDGDSDFICCGQNCSSRHAPPASRRSRIAAPLVPWSRRDNGGL